MGKKTITTEEVDDTSAAEEILEPDVIRALTELEGTGEIRWQIHRIAPPGPNVGYLITLSTPELSLERIASEGPGKYKVIGMRPDGKFFKSKTVEIGTRQSESARPLELAELVKKASSNGETGMLPLVMNLMTQNTSIVTAALARPQPEKKEFPWGAIIAAAPLTFTALKDFFKNN